MDITYKDTGLEKTFNSEEELNKSYGPAMAKKIKIRMGVLSAAPNLEKVPAEKPIRREKMSGNRTGQWSVDLGEEDRLCFMPVTDKKPDEVALEEIDKIKILDICAPPNNQEKSKCPKQ